MWQEATAKNYALVKTTTMSYFYLPCPKKRICDVRQRRSRRFIRSTEAGAAMPWPRRLLRKIVVVVRGRCGKRWRRRSQRKLVRKHREVGQVSVVNRHRPAQLGFGCLLLDVWIRLFWQWGGGRRGHGGQTTRRRLLSQYSRGARRFFPIGVLIKTKFKQNKWCDAI